MALCSSTGAACLTAGRCSTRWSKRSSKPSGPRARSWSVAGPTIWRSTALAEPAMLAFATSVANTSATAIATPAPARSSCGALGAQPTAVEVQERARPDEGAGRGRRRAGQRCQPSSRAPRRPRGAVVLLGVIAAIGHQAAVAQRQMPIRNRGRFDVVRDEQHPRAALARNRMEQLDHLSTSGTVEIARGLVRQYAALVRRLALARSRPVGALLRKGARADSRDAPTNPTRSSHGRARAVASRTPTPESMR